MSVILNNSLDENEKESTSILSSEEMNGENINDENNNSSVDSLIKTTGEVDDIYTDPESGIPLFTGTVIFIMTIYFYVALFFFDEPIDLPANSPPGSLSTKQEIVRVQ